MAAAVAAQMAVCSACAPFFHDSVVRLRGEMDTIMDGVAAAKARDEEQRTVRETRRGYARSAEMRGRALFCMQPVWCGAAAATARVEQQRMVCV
jgi:hypothetical protein